MIVFVFVSTIKYIYIHVKSYIYSTIFMGYSFFFFYFFFTYIIFSYKILLSPLIGGALHDRNQGSFNVLWSDAGPMRFVPKPLQVLALKDLEDALKFSVKQAQPFEDEFGGMFPGHFDIVKSGCAGEFGTTQHQLKDIQKCSNSRIKQKPPCVFDLKILCSWRPFVEVAIVIGGSKNFYFFMFVVGSYVSTSTSVAFFNIDIGCIF